MTFILKWTQQYAGAAVFLRNWVPSVSGIAVSGSGCGLGIEPGRSVYCIRRLYAQPKSGWKNTLTNWIPLVAQRMIKGKDISCRELSGQYACGQAPAVQSIQSSQRHVDALLVPTTCVPTRPVAEVDADLGTYLNYNAQYLRNTSIGNTLNLCGSECALRTYQRRLAHRPAHIRQTLSGGSHSENRICLPANHRLAPQHTGFVMVGR